MSNEIGNLIFYGAVFVLTFPLVEKTWQMFTRLGRKFRQKIRDRNRYDRGYIRRP